MGCGQLGKRRGILFNSFMISLQMEEIIVRQEGECKKSFYRRMAQMRKDKWATQYRNRDDHYRFHFVTASQQEKTKPISKSEPRCEQRIRNRMAAQESRERHRSYVEELQRKARQYDQLVETQQLLCRNCRQNLACDISETQEPQSQTLSKNNLGRRDEVGVESYLQEVIRIDNGSATTPFGIFFLLCVVAVLAIASIHALPGSPRLLTDADPAILEQEHGRKLRNFAEYIRSHRQQPPQPEECVRGKDQSIPRGKNLRAYALPEVGWTKMGQFICSTPEVMGEIGLESPEQVRHNQEQSARRKGKWVEDWQRVQVSQCFRGIL